MTALFPGMSLEVTGPLGDKEIWVPHQAMHPSQE